jgi:hypothetical protein
VLHICISHLPKPAFVFAWLFHALFHNILNFYAFLFQAHLCWMCCETVTDFSSKHYTSDIRNYFSYLNNWQHEHCWNETDNFVRPRNERWHMLWISGAVVIQSVIVKLYSTSIWRGFWEGYAHSTWLKHGDLASKQITHIRTVWITNVTVTLLSISAT